MSAIIRPLTEADLPAARRIARTAFGTFLGAPDPENFWADRDLVYGRFAAEHVASFAAELDGELVGSNFVTKWGSVGFFGPLTVHPDQQGRGIAKSLVEAGTATNVLLITSDTYTKWINPKDRSTRTLFGDGAAATLVSGVESE